MDETLLVKILESQYKPSLGMLRTAIEKSTNDELYSSEYSNPTWQIAYHTIWATKLYLGANYESYVPYSNAIGEAESLGGAESWENADEGVSVVGQNTWEELVSFIESFVNGLTENLESLPLNGQSGFEWYAFSRLELHLMNIRHIQHHTGELIERLKIKGITGFPWAIDGNPPQEW